jgi:hypothetical protein
MSNPLTQLEKNILLLEDHISNLRSAWKIIDHAIGEGDDRKVVVSVLNFALDVAQVQLRDARATL